MLKWGYMEERQNRVTSNYRHGESKRREPGSLTANGRNVCFLFASKYQIMLKTQWQCFQKSLIG